MLEKIRREHWLFKLPLLKNYDGIMLFGNIYLKSAELPSRWVLDHEMVHVRQYGKLGAVRFYVAYVLYYLVGLLAFLNHDRAYRNNPFEMEAYRRFDLA